MGEEVSTVEREKSEVSPEGRLLFDLIRFPVVAEKPNEVHRKIMEGILTADPAIFERIAEALKAEDLKDSEVKRYFRILDQIYGISSGQPRQQTEVAREEKVRPQRINQLRDKGLRHLLWTVQVETEEGNIALSELKNRIASGNQ